MFKSKNFIGLVRSFSNHVEVNTKHSHPPHYKLIYFDIKSIGESIRFQLVLSDAKWEDIRVPRDKWKDIKSKTGFGQLPILQINEDKEIVQSSAIGRYLANEFNLIPDHKFQKVRCDELVAVLHDVFIEYRSFVRHAAPWVIEKDSTKIQELQTNILQNVFPNYFNKMNEFVKLHGSNDFVVGNKLTWADLVLANLLDVWTSKHGSEILQKYHRLAQQKQNVFNLPKIKEWVEKRPETWV